MNKLRTLSIYSGGINKSERNYPIYDKELLQVISAFKEWRYVLEDAKHRFTV
jgi:hypothetical protein